MTDLAALPADRLREYAAQTIEFVRRAVGLELTFDSDTLPLLDHYLRNVPANQPATVELVVATAAAYFGETVRQSLGGRWETPGESITNWRVVLPTGLSFSPAGFVGAAILRTEPADLDASLEVPARMRPYLESALARMGPAGADDYYSLCGRLDTLEHLHEVLVAVAAQLMGDAADPDAEPPDDEAGDDEAGDDEAGDDEAGDDDGPDGAPSAVVAPAPPTKLPPGGGLLN